MISSMPFFTLFPELSHHCDKEAFSDGCRLAGSFQSLFSSALVECYVEEAN